MTLSQNAATTVLLFEQIVPTDMDITEVGPGWHWYLDRLAATLHNVAMPDWATTIQHSASPTLGDTIG